MTKNNKLIVCNKNFVFVCIVSEFLLDVVNVRITFVAFILDVNNELISYLLHSWIYTWIYTYLVMMWLYIPGYVTTLFYGICL